MDTRKSWILDIVPDLLLVLFVIACFAGCTRKPEDEVKTLEVTQSLSVYDAVVDNTFVVTLPNQVLWVMELYNNGNIDITVDKESSRVYITENDKIVFDSTISQFLDMDFMKTEETTEELLTAAKVREVFRNDKLIDNSEIRIREYKCCYVTLIPDTVNGMTYFMRTDKESDKVTLAGYVSNDDYIIPLIKYEEEEN